VIARVLGWKALCWIYGWTRIDGASGCSLMHIAARLRVIPWKLACTAHAVRSAVQSICVSFALRTLA
jgi:hypothetical protein